jgi:hypothetical protein
MKNHRHLIRTRRKIRRQMRPCLPQWEIGLQEIILTRPFGNAPAGSYVIPSIY